MKNMWKKVLLIVLSLLIMCMFGACGVDLGKGNGDGDDGDDKEPPRDYTGTETEINVSVYAAGYGKGWIEEACRIYEEAHPEYRFRIRANSQMFGTVKTELESNTCKADIVLVAGYDYLNLATTGKLLELTDVYDAKVPGSDTKTVRESVASKQYEYRLVGANKDKIYGMPWQDSGPNGFVYNKKMFAENNWSVPETMDEFFTLCDSIVAAGKVPLVYGGGQQDAYVQMMPETWLVQYYGYDYMQNTFEKYLSPSQYQYTYEGRLKAYQTLAKLLKGKSASGTNYVLTGSNAFQAQAAQREFIKGNAAMNICGPWFPTEMRSVLKDNPDFEYGFIPLPHINADKKTGAGADSSTENYSLAANLLAIPATSQHADVAKDFLVSMFSTESYTTYIKSNNGMTRPIDVAADVSDLNDFAKAVYTQSAAAKTNKTCVYETSSSPMAINGYLGLMNFGSADAYANMINASSYESALAEATTAASRDQTTAQSFWDDTANNWKSDYLTIT